MESICGYPFNVIVELIIPVAPFLFFISPKFAVDSNTYQMDP